MTKTKTPTTPPSARRAWPLLALLCAAVQAQEGPPAGGSLPPVRISGEREPYAAEQSSGPTGQATRIEEIAQSVSVVPRRLAEDQGARSLSEALVNVSNVRGFDSRDANNNGAFRVRGFDAAVVLDGMAVPGYFATPNMLLGIERIDVVKGPSGTLQGGAQAVGPAGFLGGVVLIDNGVPGTEPRGRVQLGLGSRGETEAGLEIDRPLGADWRLRLVAGQREEGLETRGLNLRHRLIAPTLHWQPDARRRLSLRLRYSESKGQDHAGLPARGTVIGAPYRIDRDTNLAADGLPATTSDFFLAGLQWQEDLSEALQFTLRVNRSQATLDQRGSFLFPFAFNPDPATDPLAAAPFGLLAGARLYNRIEADAISPSLRFKVEHGDWRHELSGGLDWSHVRDRGFIRFSAGGGLLGLIDVSNPQPPAWIEADTTGTPDQRNRYITQALWLQDHLRIGQRLSLLGSLRHTRFDIVDRTQSAFGNIENLADIGKTTGRLGLTWAFSPAWSGFAGWGTGVRVPVGAQLADTVKPEESRQAEIGLRLREGGLQASLSLFELSVRNALASDPANPFQSVQVGEQRSRGVELELGWTPRAGWQLVGSLGLLDTEVTRDTAASGREGKPLFNVPRRTARLYTSHELGEWAGGQTRIGLGVSHQGELPATALDAFRTGSLTLWDAQIGWRRGDWRLQLDLRNLFDREGYTPSEYFGGGQVLALPGRSARLSASLSF